MSGLTGVHCSVCDDDDDEDDAVEVQVRPLRGDQDSYPSELAQ